MGVYREFNFEDDIELLNLKYQMDNGKFMDYFNDNVMEPIEKQNKIENVKMPKEEL